VRVYGTSWANRGILHDLEGEGKCLKKGKSAFRRNGDIMVQEWKDKTRANDKYDPLCNNCKQREERQENKHQNKHYAVDQYNKFIKGIERAGQCLSYYSVLKKIVKWSKKRWYYIC
jgi:hypothetical protein